MIPSNDQTIRSQLQFGKQASFYSESVVHREGESLHVVTDYVSRGRYRQALDVATGTGFTAFAISPYSDFVLATDVTPAMINQARQIGLEKAIYGVGYALALAESLPFANGSFDLVTCRTAPHHFQGLRAAVSEWRRVLSPAGVLVMVDTTAPEDHVAAGWMNEVEIRRDPSHVRNLPPSEWISLLSEEGFEINDTTLTSVPLELEDWVRRSGTPAKEVLQLRTDMANAPKQAVNAFGIHRDLEGFTRFQWQALVVRATLWN